MRGRCKHKETNFTCCNSSQTVVHMHACETVLFKNGLSYYAHFFQSHFFVSCIFNCCDFPSVDHVGSYLPKENAMSAYRCLCTVLCNTFSNECRINASLQEYAFWF